MTQQTRPPIAVMIKGPLAPRSPGRKSRGRHRRARLHRRRVLSRVVVASLAVCVAAVGAWKLVISPRDDGGPAYTASVHAVADPEPIVLQEAVLVRLQQDLEHAGPAGMPPAAEGRVWHRRPEPKLQPAGAVQRSSAPLPPEISAERWVVIDAGSGAVLAGRNEHQPAAMASTIKVLTALTVLRLTAPEEVVTIDAEADAVGERGLWLATGEQHSVTHLLGGMLVGSANDAATALAKFVGGSIGQWANLANWLAEYYGARNTHVSNPHGLDEDGHESSAYDLAVLSRVGLADPTFARWVTTQNFEVPWPGSEYPRVAHNKNKILTDYPGGIGVKTGGTNHAGNSLIAAAERDGQTFIVVAMKSWNAAGESMALLDWAFANHTRVEAVSAGEKVKDEDGDSLVARETLAVTVPSEYADDVAVRTRHGRIEATFGGVVLGVAAGDP